MTSKIVCGSRNTKDPNVVEAVLREEFANGETMVCGYNPYKPEHQGIDQLAYEWAVANGIKGVCYPANWDGQKKSAGPIRNRKMARSGAVKCIAFPGGTGTANMIKQAREHGIEVREVGK